MPKRLGKDDRPRDVTQLARQHLVRLTTEEQEPPVKARAEIESISRGAPSSGKTSARSESELTKVTRSEISRVMAAMGSKGGKASAEGRMVKISPQERSRIALNAARARWAEPKKKRG